MINSAYMTLPHLLTAKIPASFQRHDRDLEILEKATKHEWPAEIMLNGIKRA